MPKTITFVQDGDLIEINIPDGTIELLVDEDELARRKSAWQGAPERLAAGGGTPNSPPAPTAAPCWRFSGN